jgi:hypothetical protein
MIMKKRHILLSVLLAVFECPESKKISYIDLVPYGSTTLRLTIFPEY